jgi:exosome complex RNA-binding protein Rrp4
MTKAIVSSSYMLKKLQELKAQEEYFIDSYPNREEINIDGMVIDCVCQGSGRFVVPFKGISNLMKFLSLLEEQSVTVGIGNNGWVYIKEAIL